MIGRPLAPRKTVRLAPEVLDRYVGVYRADQATTQVVTREGDHLFVQRTGGEKTEALAASETVFFYLDSPDQVRFAIDASGKVTGMTLERRIGGTEPAARTAEPLPESPPIR